jgi:thymidylate synthase (FAD)
MTLFGKLLTTNGTFTTGVVLLAAPTRLYMNGTLRSFIHYLQVRCDPSTQLEHREIAEAIKEIFCKEFPIIGEAVFSTDQ